MISKMMVMVGDVVDGVGDGTDGDGMAIMMRVMTTCDGGGLFNQLLG